MSAVEDSFPRGGREQASSKTKKRKPEEDNLFGTRADKGIKTDLEASKKTTKRQRRNEATPKPVKSKTKEKAHIEMVAYKNLKPGMLLLGIVKSVDNHSAKISLPNHMTGTVKRQEVSDYLYKLSSENQRPAEDEGEEKHHHAVKDLLSVGQVVHCIVKATGKTAKVKGIELSLRTSLFNAGLTLESLAIGGTLVGHVTSIEDHGHVVSFGIKGVNGFISRKELAASGKTLAVGQPVFGSILAINTHTKTVSLSVEEHKVANSTTRTDSLTMRTLKPGMLVSATIEKKISNGLRVSFLGFFQGDIDFNHLSICPQKGWEAVYDLKDKAKARIIFVDEKGKRVHLSLSQHIVGNRAPRVERALGDIVDTAVITKIDPAIGMYLSLKGYDPSTKSIAERKPEDNDSEEEDLEGEDKRNRVEKKIKKKRKNVIEGAPSVEQAEAGFVHISNVSDKHLDHLEKVFSVGNTQPCRIIGFSLFDGVSLLSLKQSTLEQTVMSIKDLKPGQIVEGEIAEVGTWGMLLKLGDNIKAMCTALHFGDANIKNPQQKFKTGKRIKTRVLSVNEKDKKVHLTHKPSLLSSSEVLITTYEEAKPGTVSHGFVTRVSPTGVVITFYNNVHGLLTAEGLKRSGVTDIENSYRNGQVVKVAVLKSHPKKQRIALTIDTTAAAVGGKAEKKKKENSSQKEIGAVHTGEVLEIGSEGMRVKTTTGFEGFVPSYHLTDHRSLSSAFMKVLKKGSVLRDLTVLSVRKSDGLLRLSRKRFFHHAPEGVAVPRSFADLTGPGQLLAGFVKSVSSFGVFIQFLGDMTGLAPKQYLPKGEGNLADLFPIGATVLCELKKVDTEAQKFIVDLSSDSLAVRCCPFLLESYLQESLELYNYSKEDEDRVSWDVFTLGGVCKAKVEAVKDYGVVLSLLGNGESGASSGVAALCPPSLSLPCEVGQKVNVRVLDYDFEKGVVNVVMKKDLVKVGKKKKGGETGMELNQRAEGTVLLVKPCYAIVALTIGGKSGEIGFVQMAELEAVAKGEVKEGQTYSLEVIRPAKESPDRVYENVTLLRVDSSQEKKVKRSQPAKKSFVSELPLIDFEAVKPGKIVEVKVHGIKESYLDVWLHVKVSFKIFCRIHITELEEERHLGEDHAFSKYSVGDVVQAKVLAISWKGQNELEPVGDDNPISSVHIDLSLKKEDLEKGDGVACAPRADWTGPGLKSLKEYGKVMTGVCMDSTEHGLWIQVSPKVRGFCFVTQLSSDLDVLSHYPEVFTKGRLVKCVNLSVDEEQKRLDLSVVAAEGEALSLSAKKRVALGDRASRLKAGDLVLGQVLKPKGEQQGSRLLLSVLLSPKVSGKVDITELTDPEEWKDRPLEPTQEGLLGLPSIIRCRVLAVNTDGHIDLSLRRARVEASQAEKVLVEDPLPSVGETVKGFVTSTSNKGCFVKLSRTIKARVLLRDLADGYVSKPELVFPPGRLVFGRVLKVDKENKTVDLTLKKEAKSDEGDKGKKITLEDLKEGSFVRAHVTKIERYGVFLRIVDSERLSGLCHISEASDERISDLSLLYNIGDLVKAKIIKLEGKRISFSLKPSVIKEAPLDDEQESEDEDASDYEQEKTDQEEGTNQQADDSSSDGEDGDEDMAEASDEDDEAEEEEEENSEEEEGEEEAMDVEDSKPSVGEKNSKTNDSEESETEESDSEDEGALTPAPVQTPGFVWDDAEGGGVDEEESEEESDSEEEGEDGKSHKRKQRKKQAEKRREEELIRQKEEALLSGSAAPQTADDFERLLVSSPSSSFLWVRYMAFQLSLTEFEKARAIAERALKTISYREEKEKLNVWVAYLNLEYMYGTRETLSKLFERALQVNNPKQIYLRMVAISERNNNKDEAEEMYKVMAKKFKTSKKVWTQYELFKLKNDQSEEARALLQRSLKSLSKHKHIWSISKFAQYEYEHGSPERGRTIFEGILANYPKRADLWNVYLDKEIKEGDQESIRRLFDRVINMKFSSKKMKFMFKKYLVYESEHGDEQSVEYVKQKAKEYVESIVQG